MNKVLIVSNAVFLMIIAYLLLKEPAVPVGPVEPVPPVVVNTICKDYSEAPLDGISFDAAKSLFQQYEFQYKQINQLPDHMGIDAQSVWFDLETLKKFFYKMEDTLQKQHADLDKLKLGIRIYYGSYPNETELSNSKGAFFGLPKSYAYHHTVFMVPTFSDPADSTVQNDFNPWYPGLGDDKLPSSTTKLLAQQNDSIFTKVSQTPGILSVEGKLFIKNHGQVGPPPESALPGVSMYRSLPLPE